MKFIESSHQIFTSHDYSIFRMIYGNRQLNENKIRKIKLDINKGLDLLPFAPILVSDNKELKCFDIIDGQHRFWVAKGLKKPIHFIVVPKKLALLEIAKINSNTEKWKKSDFTNCFIAQGSDDYKKLQEFMDKYELPLTTATLLLVKGFDLKDFGGGRLNTFEQGKFKIEKEMEAIQIIECCKQFNVSKVWKHRPFILAISLIMKAKLCDMQDLVAKFFKDVDQLKKQANYKDYLLNLEMIYNKGAHTRKVIYQ
jgi:hypothetical protein